MLGCRLWRRCARSAATRPPQTPCRPISECRSDSSRQWVRTGQALQTVIAAEASWRALFASRLTVNHCSGSRPLPAQQASLITLATRAGRRADGHQRMRPPHCGLVAGAPGRTAIHRRSDVRISHLRDPFRNVLQPAGFVLDPRGRVVVSVYSSGAIGRLAPEDVIGLIGYIREHPRRPVVASCAPPSARRLSPRPSAHPHAN
jgi:hypothetical protein